MRRIILVLLATIFGVTSAARAADMTPKAAPVVMAAPVIDWNGFYVGGHLGYGWNTTTTDAFITTKNVDQLIGSLATSPQGFVGGLHAGYGYMVAQPLYLGVRTDINLMALNDTSAAAAVANPITASTKQRWVGSTDLVIGLVPIGHAMIYALGGVAYGDVDSNFTLGTLNVSQGKTKVGWTWGAGVEVMLPNRWSLFTEYRRFDLGTIDVSKVVATDVPTLVSIKPTFQVDTVMAGFSKRF